MGCKYYAGEESARRTRGAVFGSDFDSSPSKNGSQVNVWNHCRMDNIIFSGLLTVHDPTSAGRVGMRSDSRGSRRIGSQEVLEI